MVELLVEPVPREKRVAVDVCPSLDKIHQLKSTGFSCFQIHFDLSVKDETLQQWCDSVGAGNLWLAPKFSAEIAFPERLFNYADTFLMDTFTEKGFGGSGKTGSWDKFSDYQSQYPDKHWILAGGLNPDNIQQAIGESSAQHVDVNSGIESAPGIKDLDQVNKFFEKFKS